ncbi:hypothetical protein N3K66_004875 [Trichothecium roseum]|uniref:Uncharacterized protein n=1 Tax=Trichothecium roseum TaxID=47278 RepID=A0ACC0V468_9HYPO|nr:hypothetical protein N3K66_004875 [Trichothecium roseum]
MSTTPSTNIILKSLNKAQKCAVTSKASTVAILAGPGSGKTHTLTSRVVWLIQEAGYQPADVIVATFTVKAAREMKERIGKLLGEEVEKKIILGTFHSIARRYLAKYGKHIGLDTKFTIADDGDTKAIIARICKRLDLGVDPGFAKSWISKTKARGTNGASSDKNPKSKDHPHLLTCFEAYKEHMERSNLLDYDDLLVKSVQLLKTRPECVANVQMVLIDEYQDTNGIQYELMKLFAQARERITVVGDPDQSIYGWRSAEIRNLYRFLREFPETEEVSLEENYRSSQSILNVSLNIIQQDKKRYQKVLLPVHTKGTRPVLRKLKSSAAEGEWIVAEIKRALAMFGDMLKPEDVAVLLRSASLSRHIESALGKAGVAYRMIGGHKFYERKEIKILLDYLRVVHSSDNNDAVARIINVPRRGIGETTIKSLLEEAEQAKMTVWSVIWKHCRGERKASTKITNKMEQKLNTELLRVINGLRQKAQAITENSQTTLVDLLEQLISQLNFKKYIEDEFSEDHEGRWANVQEFISLVNDFMKDFARTEEDALPAVGDLDQAEEDGLLGRFLANVSLASDSQKDKDGDASSVITISTIHAAKGLEWPVVFVPSVYTGSIPHSRAEDLDEERRLLYVAMTRAQSLLYLSCPLYGSQGNGSKVELSPFIEPFATKIFANKGPSFDRPVVTSAAKILGRKVPEEKAVYEKLPPMFSIEDDLFPVEPYDKENSDDVGGFGTDRNPRAAKRQRTNHPVMNADEPVTDGDTWRREYETTMEQASAFTVSMPGFTTASAHQSTMAAAAAIEKEKAAAAAAAAAVSKASSKKGTTKRPADQKSLLGFVTSSSSKGSKALTNSANSTDVGPREESKSAAASFLRYQQAKSRAAARAADAPGGSEKPAIDAEMAEHKLPAMKPFPRPQAPRPQGDEQRKPYSCFSSSPPRPPTSGGKEEQAPPPPVAEPQVSKPMTSLHNTTFVSATRGGGGVRRPVGMGKPPTISKLTAPFKPLTIKRISRPPE